MDEVRTETQTEERAAEARRRPQRRGGGGPRHGGGWSCVAAGGGRRQQRQRQRWREATLAAGVLVAVTPAVMVPLTVAPRLHGPCRRSPPLLTAANTMCPLILFKNFWLLTRNSLRPCPPPLPQQSSLEPLAQHPQAPPQQGQPWGSHQGSREGGSCGRCRHMCPLSVPLCPQRASAVAHFWGA